MRLSKISEFQIQKANPRPAKNSSEQTKRPTPDWVLDVDKIHPTSMSSSAV
jgi:hypothetical protein